MNITLLDTHHIASFPLIKAIIKASHIPPLINIVPYTNDIQYDNVDIVQALLTYILDNVKSNQKTKIALLYSNKRGTDMWLKPFLDNKNIPYSLEFVENSILPDMADCGSSTKIEACRVLRNTLKSVRSKHITHLIPLEMSFYNASFYNTLTYILGSKITILSLFTPLNKVMNIDTTITTTTINYINTSNSSYYKPLWTTHFKGIYIDKTDVLYK